MICTEFNEGRFLLAYMGGVSQDLGGILPCSFNLHSEKGCLA